MFTFEMNQHSPSICQRSRIAREAKIIFNEHVSPVNVCARSGGPFAVCLPSFEKETNLNSDNPQRLFVSIDIDVPCLFCTVCLKIELSTSLLLIIESLIKKDTAKSCELNREASATCRFIVRSEISTLTQRKNFRRPRQHNKTLSLPLSPSIAFFNFCKHIFNWFLISRLHPHPAHFAILLTARCCWCSFCKASFYHLVEGESKSHLKM